MAMGARPRVTSLRGRTCWGPPQAASAAGAVSASSASTWTSIAARFKGAKSYPSRAPARTPHALPDDRVRDLLPDRPRPLVAADAALRRLEAVHRRGELHLLRRRGSQVLLPARRDHGREPGGRGADLADGRRGEPQADLRGGGRAGPAHAGHLQVLRLLRRRRRR